MKVMILIIATFLTSASFADVDIGQKLLELQGTYLSTEPLKDMRFYNGKEYQTVLNVELRAPLVDEEDPQKEIYSVLVFSRDRVFPENPNTVQKEELFAFVWDSKGNISMSPNDYLTFKKTAPAYIKKVSVRETLRPLVFAEKKNYVQFDILKYGKNREIELRIGDNGQIQLRNFYHKCIFVIPMPHGPSCTVESPFESKTVSTLQKVK